jgi:hypothetical protein
VHRKFSDPLGKQRVGLLQGVSLKPWPPSRGFCLPEPQKKSAKRAAYISPASSAIRPLAPKLALLLPNYCVSRGHRNRPSSTNGGRTAWLPNNTDYPAILFGNEIKLIL